MNNTKEDQVVLVKITVVASILMIAISIALIFLLRFIENKTGKWPLEIWGMIFVILCFSFAFYYLFFNPFFFDKNEKKKEDEGSQNLDIQL